MKSEHERPTQDQGEHQAGAIGRALEFKDRTLPRVLQIQAALGEKVMLQSSDRKLTYAEAPIAAARYAGKLISEGVKSGDRIIVYMSNSIELIELWFGAAWIGVILVPINTAFRGEQLRHAIQTAEPTLIITETSLVPHLQAASNEIKQVKMVFVIDRGEPVNSHSISTKSIKYFTADADPINAEPVNPGDSSAILYTSGTTGPSKGVLCPHAQFYWWGVLTGESLGINEDDVLYTVLPFFHTNALNTLWQCMLNGATFSFSTRFSASRFWQEASSNKATITYLLGAMAHILLKRPPAELDKGHHIRAALCPATPIEMVEEFKQRFGVNLIEGYGSTETNLVFSNVIGGHAPGSMGRVVDGFEVRLVDENDCDVEQGEPGELIIRHCEPYSMANGYFGNPEATVKAWKNLWFHTGDRVVCKENGIYYFLDRMVDAIRRRGENISSWEVENALIAHAHIESAAVVGVPSDVGSEEEVMAFIVAQHDCTLDLVAIIRFLESRLAYFAIPRYWEIVAELPLTENGKIKKHDLRDQGVTTTSWDREKEGVVLNRY